MMAAMPEGRPPSAGGTNPQPDARDLLPPWQKPLEPDHPMILKGGSVPGDPELMMRCLFEELLANGISADEIRRMLRSRLYGALHVGRQALGEARVLELLDQAASRAGMIQARVWEAPDSVLDVTLTIHGRPVDPTAAEDH